MLAVALFGPAPRAFAGPDLLYPELVGRFYKAHHHHMFWVCDSPHAAGLRTVLLQNMDSSARVTGTRNRYNFNELVAINETISSLAEHSITLWHIDMLYTDAVIAYCEDLYHGGDMKNAMHHGEWLDVGTSLNDFIVNNLAAVKNPADLLVFFGSLAQTAEIYTTGLKGQPAQSNHSYFSACENGPQSAH